MYAETVDITWGRVSAVVPQLSLWGWASSFFEHKKATLDITVGPPKTEFCGPGWGLGQ